jgi:hypothetical protein
MSKRIKLSAVIEFLNIENVSSTEINRIEIHVPWIFQYGLQYFFG